MTLDARMHVLTRTWGLSFFLLLLAMRPASATSHLGKSITVAEEAVTSTGNYSYTLEQLSPSTQGVLWLDGTAPYFFLLLTNTGDDDTYHMVVSDIDDPLNWFGQVCIGMTCFPDSVDHPLASGQSDSVGVQVVPFTEGTDTFTFTLSSLGDPTLVSVYEFTLITAFTDDVRPIADGDGFELLQNSPNPVRTTTAIRFTLPRDEWISLRIYDVTGRTVRTLSEGRWPSGSHSVMWDGMMDTGGTASAGIYFYGLGTPRGELAKRMTVLR